MSAPSLNSQPITLASASTTRLALLRAAGLDVQVRATNLDEARTKRAGRIRGEHPGEVALALARGKALACGGPGWVIGADQLLVCGSEWFDKPPDLAAARRQLLRLRGRPHTLFTAVVLAQGGRIVWCHVARPRLVMRAFSSAFLDDYLAREAERLLASVGGYRLEGLGLQLFSAVRGEQSAILGLPLLPLLAELRRRGLLPG